MPFVRPSLVSACAAHSLGNKSDLTHSYTSILDPGNNLPQLFFLNISSPCSYHIYFVVLRSHHNSPTCSSIQLVLASIIVAARPIVYVAGSNADLNFNSCSAIPAIFPFNGSITSRYSTISSFKESINTIRSTVVVSTRSVC